MPREPFTSAAAPRQKLRRTTLVLAIHDGARSTTAVVCVETRPVGCVEALHAPRGRVHGRRPGSPREAGGHATEGESAGPGRARPSVASSCCGVGVRRAGSDPPRVELPRRTALPGDGPGFPCFVPSGCPPARVAPIPESWSGAQSLRIRADLDVHVLSGQECATGAKNTALGPSPAGLSSALEVRTGFEPAYNGFANRCLTTWLPHRPACAAAAGHASSRLGCQRPCHPEARRHPLSRPRGRCTGG
jgi:hypothetical protein